MWPFRRKDFVKVEKINGRKVDLKVRVGDTLKVDLPDGSRAEIELTEEEKKAHRYRR